MSPGLSAPDSRQCFTLKACIHYLEKLKLTVSLKVCRCPYEHSSLVIELSNQAGGSPSLTLENSQAEDVSSQWDASSSFSQARVFMVQPEESSSGRDLENYFSNQYASHYQPVRKLSATCIVSLLSDQTGCTMCL